MRVFLQAEINPIKGGIEARSRSLRLAGHGRDIGEALDCLQRGILAWCRGLAACGQLEIALRDKNVRVEEGDSSAIVIDVSEYFPRSSSVNIVSCSSFIGSTRPETKETH